MAESLFPFAYLPDARLAGLATAAAPAWLWQPDGRRLLWANAEAATMFAAHAPSSLTCQSFAADHPTATQIARLAEALPANGSPRLAALEIPVDGPEYRPMCLCSRLTLNDATPAILAVATETGRPPLPLAERAQRLLADTDAPVAAFAPRGELLCATPAAAERIGRQCSLASLGASLLGSEALSKGHAKGATPLGLLQLDRIGRDDTVVLLVTFPATPADAPPASAEFTPHEPPPIAHADAPSDSAEAAEPEPAAPLAAASRDADADPQPPPPEPERPAEHPHPLRFVWQMDQDGRFTVTSEAFMNLIGPDNAAVLGQPWIDVARKLALDPDEHISRAIDSRETWSGITVSWPVADAGERLMVDMSGLPMFDRERIYLGYRGFGVCRDADHFAARPQPAAATPSDVTAPPAEPSPVEAEPRPPEQHEQPQNIVPFRSASGTETATPSLSAGERTAFRELARQLSARLKGDQPEATAERRNAIASTGVRPAEPEPAAPTPAARDGISDLMQRLPVGVLVYRLDTPIYANRAFLKWSGDASLDAFTASGGLDRLFLESDVTGEQGGNGKRLTLTTGNGSGLAESRLFSITWDGERAHALAIVPMPSAQPVENTDLQGERRRAGELRSIVDISTDGIVIIDHAGAVVRLSQGAEALFGCESETVESRPFVELLAQESRNAAATDFAALAHAGARQPGLEVNARSREAGPITLFMTLGRIEAEHPTYCAVFRDITRWKHAEQELLAAKRHAEQASRAKSDFLAKISHEIRTPLNAIIGFSEVMMEERLGPIDNERYRAYLKDIHASGEHLVALLNDLLDLSKIEAGKLELTFASVNLNELTQQCVALMQQQANNARVIIRTSLATALPPIVADARSVRQILLNLLSNSIKFTAAGGQVIVSTAVTDGNEAVLRVRDTGIGMSEKEIETALEPFRQIETSARGGSGGTGLGLPLTKALAEANRANFAIKSNVNSGTLVEVAFPTTSTSQR
jgi:PAS domain S-box-containing protein